MKQSMATAAPILFSIIALFIRAPQIDRQEYSYSVNIEFFTNCVSKSKPNITLSFQSTVGGAKQYTFPFKTNVTFTNLTYGVDYTIDGYLLCGKQNITLSERKRRRELISPKYVNSTSTPTSIDTLFVLPGLFHRLFVEIRSINRTCSIRYSPMVSPFYNCSFSNLPSAESFHVTYYLLTEYNQTIYGDPTIVYTELEDLNFTCQLDETNERILLFWSNFTSPGYTHSDMLITIQRSPFPWWISCDPIRSQGNCSIKADHLEPGTDYLITARLTKVLFNYTAEKLGNCSIKTSLSPIPENSIEHEFLDATSVLLNWFEHPFLVHVRIIDLETNSVKYPSDNNQDQKSALFTNLTEASIYRVEFDISKENFPSVNQTTDHFIQTNLTKLILRNVVRSSESSFSVDINEYPSSKGQISYCISKVFENNSQICSKSSQFTQLSAGTIYNVSVNIHRASFKNRFFWSNQTVFQLVDTSFSPLETRGWESPETCEPELSNIFPPYYSIECHFNTSMINCSELRCGCKYQLKVKFNERMIDDLCSSSLCDIQQKNSNFTITKIQRPLERIKNFHLVNASSTSKQIEIDFEKLSGCFDRWNLICEIISSKKRNIFSNSKICTNLQSDQTYQVYVHIERTGWKTVHSNSIKVKLGTHSDDDQDTIEKGTNISWILVSCIIGILVLIAFTTFLFVYQQRRREQPTQQSITMNNKTTSNKLNNIVNHVNIYSISKQNHPSDSKKVVLLSRPIRIQDLVNEYEKLIANDYYHASDEYEKLQNSIQEYLPLTQVNQSDKNRYEYIIPYEHTRVKLSPVTEQDSGYINASFITGLHNQQEYIACQGPLKTTINDHWRMIWKQHVNTIVMLTALVERGATTCEQYWPIEVEQASVYGEISVCVTACLSLPTFDLRHIQLKKNDKVRCIKHYAFKMWDEQTVPTNGGELVNFIRFIRSEYRPEGDGPILVHCNAGVGRTGTFIALDRLIKQFDKSLFNGCLDIYGTVLELRRCRDKMVQTEAQYLFVYRCLKEEYEKRLGESNYEVIADDAV